MNDGVIFNGYSIIKDLLPNYVAIIGFERADDIKKLADVQGL